MKFNVIELDKKYDFEITGSSFIGNPVDGTVLFITDKVRNLLSNINGHRNCLVFADSTIDIPDEFKENNCFILCEDAQNEYGIFARKISAVEKKLQRSRKYTTTPEGYIIGENTVIGENAYIEKGCLIDHDVVIGKNAEILFGSVIRNATIGDNFCCAENCVIGTEPYFYAGEPKYKIPAFGKVIIGNNVEFGSNVIIEKGFNSDTVIKDGVKLDANVSLGHDDILEEDVQMTCGATLAGMVTVGARTYIGLNATVKQRLNIGKDALVGMGAVVVSNVKAETKVFGNPAKKLKI